MLASCLKPSAFWRQRMGHEPVGAKLLVVLVFAGTLLTIVPAAQLLNPS